MSSEEQEPFVCHAECERRFGNAECEAWAAGTEESVALISFSNLPVPSQFNVDEIPASCLLSLICARLAQA